MKWLKLGRMGRAKGHRYKGRCCSYSFEELLHTLPNSNLLLLRHSGVLLIGQHTALPSLALQTAHAAQEKAIVSDLSSAAELLHPSSPPAQVPGMLLHHLSRPQMSVRELLSDLGTRSDTEAFPALS